MPSLRRAAPLRTMSQEAHGVCPARRERGRGLARRGNRRRSTNRVAEEPPMGNRDKRGREPKKPKTPTPPKTPIDSRG